MKTKALLTYSLLTLLLAAAGSSRAALSFYFQMDGIPGDANQAPGHVNDSVINDFSWSVVTNTSGTPAFTFTLQKYGAQNSPVIAGNCANGITSPTATLKCYKSAGGAGGSSLLFYTVTLTNVTISSVNFSNTPDDEQFNETISLQFSAIQWSYAPQNPNGSLGAPIITSFSPP